VGAEFGDDGGLGAAAVRQQFLDVHGEFVCGGGGHGVVPGDADRGVDEPEQRQGEGAPAHQPHGGGEAQDVGVGDGQVVGADGEAADPFVGGQPGEVHAQAGQDEPGGREGGVGAGAFEGGEQGTAQQQGGEGGGAGEDAGGGAGGGGHGGHAPSRLWARTRTIWPWTAPEPGWASQAVVSATSAGRPPWAREFMRRPASRMKRGTAAVILVSMKPGATALTVTPWAASARGARERTRPMMPALAAP